MTRLRLRAAAAVVVLAVIGSSGTGSLARADPTPTMSTAAVATTTTTTACASAPVAPPRGTTQLLVVTARTVRATTATLDALALSNGCWVRRVGPLFARLGRHGLARHRREGDGTTPLGQFALGATLLGDGPDPHDAYPYRRLVCGDWWDEDPASPSYDELVRVPCGVAPRFSGEPLWLEGNAYPILAVIEFNPHRVPGVGSGIFLHADYGQPTDGCVAVPVARLYPLLAWLRPGDRPVIDIRVVP